MIDPIREMPMGFGMALLQNARATAAFQRLSAAQQAQVLQRTHQIASKAEMRALVEQLADGTLPTTL